LYFPGLIKDTRDIAEEGLKLIQTKLGTTAYLENYNAVRQDVLEKRRERKMKRSLEVITDPERAAKMKIRHHEKVKDSKKRKVEKFKADRLKYGK
jgi:U3 small nucleolar RNA-associated protein 20